MTRKGLSFPVDSPGNPTLEIKYGAHLHQPASGEALVELMAPACPCDSRGPWWWLPRAVLGLALIDPFSTPWAVLPLCGGTSRDLDEAGPGKTTSSQSSFLSMQKVLIKRNKWFHKCGGGFPAVFTVGLEHAELSLGVREAAERVHSSHLL